MEIDDDAVDIRKVSGGIEAVEFVSTMSGISYAVPSDIAEPRSAIVSYRPPATFLLSIVGLY